ncbi:MAG: hypothetical protein Udaeo2_21470 [Candidatus Udaeobacter sp.]|nr:MAG: hypothetical protein Udaeo2_21470 [Candidatus Udaeobacter sp.]
MFAAKRLGAVPPRPAFAPQAWPCAGRGSAINSSMGLLPGLAGGRTAPPKRAGVFHSSWAAGAQPGAIRVNGRAWADSHGQRRGISDLLGAPRR